MRDDILETKRDRRKAQRVTFEFLSLIHAEKTGMERERNVVGRVRNISPNGAFFYTKESLREKTPVSMDIYLLKSREAQDSDSNQIKVIKVSGNVVRTEPDGMAVKFNEDLRTEISSLEDIAGTLF